MTVTGLGVDQIYTLYTLVFQILPEVPCLIGMFFGVQIPPHCLEALGISYIYIHATWAVFIDQQMSNGYILLGVSFGVGGYTIMFIDISYWNSD